LRKTPIFSPKIVKKIAENRNFALLGAIFSSWALFFRLGRYFFVLGAIFSSWALFFAAKNCPA
jgi:hypothetical protein